ncbi:VOC family protein [Fodinicurvata fenggangensis]|uniref:VOC family protein n=1 Tax=Fodinicurvata fenggangensis TaxID=1121830 RepID=UPI000692505F|nr:VOC family protein [Fodinicurvata fenggangensis]
MADIDSKTCSEENAGAVPGAIYLNLPVADLGRSRRFFEALGYRFNEPFSNDEVACLILSDQIRAMLHLPASLKRFTKKDIADAHSATEVLLALQLDSRAAVDALMDRALAAGAAEPRAPEEHGYMYGRTFEDPDGHIWEAFWMDPAHSPR